MNQCGQIAPQSTALSMSASLVFVKQEENPLMATDTWRCADISHTRDLVKYCKQQQ
jgi:hypothetical protein